MFKILFLSILILILGLPLSLRGFTEALISLLFPQSLRSTYILINSPLVCVLIILLSPYHLILLSIDPGFGNNSLLDDHIYIKRITEIISRELVLRCTLTLPFDGILLS